MTGLGSSPYSTHYTPVGISTTSVAFLEESLGLCLRTGTSSHTAPRRRQNFCPVAPDVTSETSRPGGRANARSTVPASDSGSRLRVLFPQRGIHVVGGDVQHPDARPYQLLAQ